MLGGSEFNQRNLPFFLNLRPETQHIMKLGTCPVALALLSNLLLLWLCEKRSSTNMESTCLSCTLQPPVVRNFLERIPGVFTRVETENSFSEVIFLDF